MWPPQTSAARNALLQKVCAWTAPVVRQLRAVMLSIIFGLGVGLNLQKLASAS